MANANKPTAADVDWAHLLATQILGQFRKAFPTFDALSVADRQLLADIAADAAALQLVAVASNLDPADAREGLRRDKLQIDAQLTNIAAIAELGGVQVFWDAFRRVSEKAMGMLAVAVTAVI